MEYGCVVTNKFGLVSDDDSDIEDPRELIERVAKADADKAAAAKRAAAIAKATASLPAKKPEPSKPAAKDVRTGGERGGRGGRGGASPRDRRPKEELADRFGESSTRGAPRGRGGPRPNRGRGGAANPQSSEAAPADTSFEAVVKPEGQDARERRGGPRGNGRGGRGSRGREYDRRSGSDRTGVRSVDKKDGHGKGNWGGVKDDIAGETEPNVEGGEPQEQPLVPREKTAEELQYELDMEAYSKQKTLKEFKAELKAKEEAAFKTRKAGEGSQDNFGRLVPIQKPRDEKSDDEEAIIIRKESSKKVVPIDIRYTANRGRAAERARERRGGPRNQGGSNFNAGSSDDFPALQ